jgi:multidrug efflux system outer membrane protein
LNRLFPCLLALTLGACSLAPDYARPDAPVPPSWPEGEAYAAQRNEALPSISFEQIFTDPRLRQLTAEALANNRDLRRAAANIAEARAQVRVARADQLPVLGAGASAEYRDESGGGRENYALQGGIAGFELDLFGKYASATEAERENLLATEAGAEIVRIGLVADLASAWVTYAADRDLLAIAQETSANAGKSVDLTRLRLEGGIAPRTDLRQAQQVLSAAEGDLAAQKAALAQDENLIRLLVGDSFDRGLLPAGLGEIVDTIAALPAGTSSEVLLRRPDVVQAEHLLLAANADIGVARARLFPSISLTGLLGFASDALGTLFDSEAFGATAGADTSYAIFSGGGRRAGVAVSEAQRDAALAAYEKSIQLAFREMSDALATQGTIADRLAAARMNSEAAADTAQLTDARYRGGVDSFLANLVAQRSLYSSRRQETAIELIALLNRIELYRALGGEADLAPPLVR